MALLVTYLLSHNIHVARCTRKKIGARDRCRRSFGTTAAGYGAGDIRLKQATKKKLFGNGSGHTGHEYQHQQRTRRRVRLHRLEQWMFRRRMMNQPLVKLIKNRQREIEHRRQQQIGRRAAQDTARQTARRYSHPPPAAIEPRAGNQYNDDHDDDPGERVEQERRPMRPGFWRMEIAGGKQHGPEYFSGQISPDNQQNMPDGEPVAALRRGEQRARRKYAQPDQGQHA